MKLTPKQHRNIANGIDRMRNHCLVAKDDGKYYHANEEGTYFSDRFKKECSHIFEAHFHRGFHNFGSAIAKCKLCGYTP